MIIKVEGGYKITSHKDPEKVYPKVYETREDAEKRIDEMTRHSKPKEETKK